MKHFYISILIFVIILVSGVVSNIYVANTISYMYRLFEDFTDIEAVTIAEERKLSELKDEFYRQKNMLQLFINKEHIEEVEIDIIQLESAVKDMDTQQCKESSIEAAYTLRFIKENQVAFD